MATKKVVEQQPAAKAKATPVNPDQAAMQAYKPAAEKAMAVEAKAPPAQEPVEPEEAEQDEQEAEAPVEAEVQQQGEEPTQTDLNLTDDQVVAQIGEIDQQGKVHLRVGNRAYAKTRHQIGQLLETNYGRKDRQKRGKRIVKEVSRRYDISTSELYRCWRFYKARPDFDAFCAEFPDLSTWSEIKELLPTLEQGGDVEAKRKKDRAQSLVERIHSDLKALTRLAGELRDHVSPNDLRELASQLQKTSQEVVALVIFVVPPANPEEPATT